MFRYVHYEVTCALLAVCATVVSAAVVFGMEGVPGTPRGIVPAIALGLLFLALTAGFGVLTVSRLKWFGEGRDFDKAVPLGETGTVLPTRAKGYRHCVNVPLFVFMVAFALGGGLFWDRGLALSPLFFASAWSARGWWVARWEQRHGLLLWNRRVRTRPPEGGRYLYSSVR
ncbi:hypothetical protein [Streptomyces sp. NBC_00576]|uniref:hypothetical protein n=1 Tax=Streptomyces sp. NBC_00576 TaxID=2903665 RepID=UPI002E81141D|nr:hypothetical protein [Streptomyces sp. NBC_00576]WUB69046.1 hypothetical protein OG734_02500 [Streptomyces sp. NBC_00576]